MGKIRAKSSKHRSTPTGLPTFAELEKETEMTVVPTDSTIHPLVAQLASEDPHEREFACGALANIVLDEATSKDGVPMLLRQGLLHRLLTCLVDTESKVSAEAAGCLRNLGLYGGHSVCLSMVEAGVIPVLAQVLSKEAPLLVDWISTDATQRQRAEVAVLAVDNGVGLLWMLCEESSKALEQMMETPLLGLLIQLVDPAKVPRNIAISTAQCLHTISDDNPVVTAVLVQNSDLLSGLRASAATPAPENDAGALLLRLVHAGILWNVVGALDTELAGAMFGALHQGLSINSGQLLCDVLPCLADIKDNDQALHKSNAQKEAEAKVENTSIILGAQQLALELLTNLAAVSEEEEWEEVEVQDDEEMGDSDAVDMADDQVDQDAEADTRVAPSWAPVLASSGVPALVLQCCQCAPSHTYQVLSSGVHGKDLLEGFNALQLRALSALNNMLLADEIPGMQLIGMEDSWAALSPLLPHILPAALSPDLTSSLTTTVWTLLRRVASKPALASAFNPSAECMHGLLLLTNGDEATRVNVVGIIGTLSKMPTLQAGLMDMAQILSRSLEDESLAVVAEALNSIYDGFDEANSAVAVRETQLLEKMQAMLPTLKKK
eukprot:Ihof_evm3s675 gene=Ihof_evmTU3s675